MDQDDFQMFKIAVIGDSGTGKTNISLRFVQDQFVDGFKPTVGVQFLNKVLTVEGTRVKVTFWDTAGQERYKSLGKVYYKGALGIIIVYDVTQQQSYLNVQSWMRLVNENLNIKDVVIIILGNKIDLQDKKVPFEKVLQDYKQKYGIECFQVSAKTGQGVQEAIKLLIDEIYKKNVQSNSDPPVVDIMQDSNYQSVMPSFVQKVQTKVVKPQAPKSKAKVQQKQSKKKPSTKPKQGQTLNQKSKPKKSSSSCC